MDRREYMFFVISDLVNIKIWWKYMGLSGKSDRQWYLEYIYIYIYLKRVASI
jgi:hypothetical protein